jgi:serine/threonine protein kinase
MSAPSTADEFLELTARSGLLGPQQLRAFVQRRREAGALPRGARALANVMVRDGLLTRFQAEQLLRGKWRNFVLSGKYRILGPLGAGGMGQVYLCEHQVMRRRVAVKVLPDRSDDPVALERFHREARAVAQLNHPNIVGGHDIDRDGQLHFLVMEYIDGSTFHAIVKRRGPMAPLRAAHYIRQAALGLQHAHEAGLVHRDIKPSNLLLDRSGTVKVLDLGLARFFHDEADDISRRHAESPLGTMDYMAPEQARDSHQADVRADIYSLGATFYFLLAGHGPFRRGPWPEKLLRHQLERPRPIRELRPDVPEGLAAVLERMMAVEPEQRFRTPAKVAEALAPWTQKLIPPPPPEEMPELAAPARGSGDAAAPALPASLFEAVSSRTPAPGQEGDTSLSGSQAPTAPLVDVAVELHAMPVLVGDVRLQAAAPPPSSAPANSAGAVATSRPGSLPSPSAASTEADSSAPPPSEGERPPRRGALFAALAILLLGVGALAFAAYEAIASRGQPASPGAGADRAPRLRLLVPAYIYPAAEGQAHWHQIIDAAATVPTVVIANTATGPGTAADPNYTKVLERARLKGVTVIGYVSTHYGDRPPDEVKDDVDRWVRFYPGIQGIFFDEQASTADRVDYYAALYEHVRQARGLSLVVTNPGTQCAEDYFARPASDVGCLVEAPRGFSTYRRPAWTHRYPADRFAALICKVGSAEQMKTIVRETRDNNVGYCFITDADEPNPWGRLPAYWEDELDAVRQANGP